MRSLDGFKGDSRFNTWVYTIVQRQIAKQSWRKQAKELVIEQIAKTGNLSRDLLGQIEKLADTSTASISAWISSTRC